MIAPSAESLGGTGNTDDDGRSKPAASVSLYGSCLLWLNEEGDAGRGRAFRIRRASLVMSSAVAAETTWLGRRLGPLAIGDPVGFLGPILKAAERSTFSVPA